jgi:hypothetical protein
MADIGAGHGAPGASHDEGDTFVRRPAHDGSKSRRRGGNHDPIRDDAIDAGAFGIGGAGAEVGSADAVEGRKGCPVKGGRSGLCGHRSLWETASDGRVPYPAGIIKP